jgi:hypothetical protein
VSAADAVIRGEDQDAGGVVQTIDDERAFVTNSTSRKAER